MGRPFVWMVLLPARDAAVVSLFRGFGLSVEILGPLTQLRSHLVPHGDPKQFAASPGKGPEICGVQGIVLR